jgi:hypothetical protein
VGALDEALEEEGGDFFGATLLELVAAGECEEGLASLGDGGEENADFRHLGGAAAVFEGVEVAFGGAGAGAAASLAGLFSHRPGRASWAQTRRRIIHWDTSSLSVGLGNGRSKGEGAAGVAAGTGGS